MTELPADRLTTTPEERERRLRSLLRLQKFNCWLFWLSIASIFLGGCVALASQNWTVYIPAVGFIGAGILIAQGYLVYPFLRCPNCGNRFFILNGFWGIVERIDPHRRTCRHCGLSADSSR